MNARSIATTAEQLREWFNSSDLPDRIANSRLRPHVDHSHPAPEKLPFPVGTVSQIVTYYDPDDVAVVTIHQYLTPDGTIAASGIQDPKGIRRDDVWYFCL
jgi:hypothetical protein